MLRFLRMINKINQIVVQVIAQTSHFLTHLTTLGVLIFAGIYFRVFSRILVIGDIREIKYPRNTRFFAFYLQF